MPRLIQTLSADLKAGDIVYKDGKRHIVESIEMIEVKSPHAPPYDNYYSLNDGAAKAFIKETWTKVEE